VVAFLQATQGFRRLDQHRPTTIRRRTREGASDVNRQHLQIVFDAASTLPVIR
jgi:hypothetical protein